MLAEKAIKILNALVNNKKTPLTTKMLADLLEMSERSVSSYLKEVAQFCEQESIELVSKPGTGIRLNLDDDTLFKISKYIKPEASYFSADYRRWYIINLLLNNWTTYTMALFADDLNVSKASVKSDLDAATKWLNNFGIKVVSRPGSGIALDGDELFIRGAIVFANRKSNSLNLTPREERTPDYRIDADTKERLTHNYRSANLGVYIKGIQDFEKNKGVILTEDGFLMVLEHMLVQKRRVLVENYVSIPAAAVDSADLSAAEPLIERLHSENLLPIQEDEHRYAAMLLRTAETASEDGQAEISGAVSELSHRIVQYVSDFTGMGFTEDSVLRDRIKKFLSVSLVRVRFGFQLPSPLLAQAKQAYPSVFSVCYAAGQLYKDAVGIYPSENELSHLALIFGNSAQNSNKHVRAVMISAAGVASARLIEIRLSEELPNLEIAAVLPFTEADKIEELSPQLVITTTKAFKHKIHTVFVSSMAGPEDINRLRRECNAIAGGCARSENGVTFNQLLKPELIQLKQHFPTVEKVLRAAAAKLEAHGYVDGRYYEDTIAREQIAPTAIGRGIAIPHSHSGTVKAPAVCFISLDKSIDWGGEAVDLIFALALDFVDIKSTSAFFKAFYSIVNNTETVINLRRASSAEEIKKIVADRCG
jgi:transcriptional antiterminator/mannitol/fructose-specific phosphotransferase system IIA component (Ntr-type)